MKSSIFIIIKKKSFSDQTIFNLLCKGIYWNKFIFRQNKKKLYESLFGIQKILIFTLKFYFLETEASSSFIKLFSFIVSNTSRRQITSFFTILFLTWFNIVTLKIYYNLIPVEIKFLKKINK